MSNSLSRSAAARLPQLALNHLARFNLAVSLSVSIFFSLVGSLAQAAMTRLCLMLPGASITSSSSRAHAPTMRHALWPSGQVACVGELGSEARAEVGLGLELDLEEDRALRHRARTA